MELKVFVSVMIETSGGGGGAAAPLSLFLLGFINDPNIYVLNDSYL